MTPDAPVAVAPHDAVVDRPEHPGRIPPFPVSTAERGIEAVSRLAGPVIFVLALAGVVWLLLK